MKSNVTGKSTSRVEVTNISKHGLWILIDEKEYFLPFSDFPWFRDARIAEIQDVKLQHPNHLYWPQLDVDLSTGILDNVESYPLTWK